jgi:hypothetical protein
MALAACLIPTAAAAQTTLSAGQTVYASAYTHITLGPKGPIIGLSVTLDIHNADPQRPITILSAEFHDADGKLLKNYQPTPLRLPPMASIQFLVDKDKAESRKKPGKCFLVRWQAAEKVNPPVIQCLMIGATGQQGISFTNQGRVVKEAAR